MLLLLLLLTLCLLSVTSGSPLKAGTLSPPSPLIPHRSWSGSASMRRQQAIPSHAASPGKPSVNEVRQAAFVSLATVVLVLRPSCRHSSEERADVPLLAT